MGEGRQAVTHHPAPANAAIHWAPPVSGMLPAWETMGFAALHPSYIRSFGLL